MWKAERCDRAPGRAILALMDKRAGPIKLVILPRTLAGLGRDGLRRHLSTVHGPMVMAEPEVSQAFRSYVHHYAVDCPVAGEMTDRDAVTVIRFDAMADMIASKASDAYRQKIGPDEDNFREIAGSVAMFSLERVIAPGADDAHLKLFAFHATGENDRDTRAESLANVATMIGVQGIVTNHCNVVEGAWDHCILDEIGLRTDADVVAIVRALIAHPPRTETRFLLSEPLRFI